MSIDNKDKEGPEQYHKLDEILITRKIERNKGSKYYLNGKEVRARDAQTFFADLSFATLMIKLAIFGSFLKSGPGKRSGHPRQAPQGSFDARGGERSC